MCKILMISIHIFIIKYQCHCRIIHYVDTFDHISRYSGSFNLTGYKSFIFCISYRYKGISIYSFFTTIRTTNHYSKLVHRCLSTPKPLPDIRTQCNTPNISLR